MPLASVVWGRMAAREMKTGYIGRRGAAVCDGVDVYAPKGAVFVALTPQGVSDCKIDIPNERLGELIEALQAVERHRLAEIVDEQEAEAESVELKCDMVSDCTAEVTHIDNKGYIYCTEHGIERRDCRPCRALRKWELAMLKAGEQVPSYTPGPKPKAVLS